MLCLTGFELYFRWVPLKNAMKEKPNVVSASLAQKIIPSNYFNVLNETLNSHLPV